MCRHGLGALAPGGPPLSGQPRGELLGTFSRAGWTVGTGHFSGKTRCSMKCFGFAPNTTWCFTGPRIGAVQSSRPARERRRHSFATAEPSLSTSTTWPAWKPLRLASCLRLGRRLEICQRPGARFRVAAPAVVGDRRRSTTYTCRRSAEIRMPTGQATRHGRRRLLHPRLPVDRAAWDDLTRCRRGCRCGRAFGAREPRLPRARVAAELFKMSTRVDILLTRTTCQAYRWADAPSPRPQSKHSRGY